MGGPGVDHELEILAGGSVVPGPQTIPAYALYYVCEDVNGACLYRRQYMEIEIEVLPVKGSAS